MTCLLMRAKANRPSPVSSRNSKLSVGAILVVAPAERLGSKQKEN